MLFRKSAPCNDEEHKNSLKELEQQKVREEWKHQQRIINRFTSQFLMNHPYHFLDRAVVPEDIYYNDKCFVRIKYFDNKGYLVTAEVSALTFVNSIVLIP